MKFVTLLLACLCSSLMVSAQDRDTRQEFLEVGSTVFNYPKVEWLKGEPVTSFDKDKIYIIELWATWCIPCIAAMPHINELNGQFKDKGFVFIGQNVMENDKVKAEAFVKNKGDGLSYRIAYAGAAGNDFDEGWLKPAGVFTIPQTFIIQHNKLVWQTEPGMLNEKVLQLLADGKFTIEAATALNKR